MTKEVNMVAAGGESRVHKETTVPLPLLWLTSIGAMMFGYFHLEAAEQEAFALLIMRIVEECREAVLHVASVLSLRS
jgi:hypothetical protein